MWYMWYINCIIVRSHMQLYIRDRQVSGILHLYSLITLRCRHFLKHQHSCSSEVQETYVYKWKQRQRWGVKTRKDSETYRKAEGGRLMRTAAASLMWASTGPCVSKTRQAYWGKGISKHCLVSCLTLLAFASFVCYSLKTQRVCLQWEKDSRAKTVTLEWQALTFLW